MLKVDSDLVIIAGGKDAQRNPRAEAYFLNWKTGRVTPLHAMRLPRFGGVCGRVDDKIVLAGGNLAEPAETEIFDLDTLEWSDGPQLPLFADFEAGKRFEFYTQTVANGEDSFYVVGGSESGGDIYEFIGGNMTWVKREESLGSERYGHIALASGAECFRG